MSHASALSAKVAAVNRANSVVNAMAPAYRAFFASLAGQKVTKADGSLTASVKAKFPQIASQGCQVYCPHVGCFVVKTSESYGEHSCTYAEPYFYAFTVSRQTGLCETLQSEFTPLRADYTAAEVIKLREAAEVAREAARQAEAALSPFGTHDN